jgi:hypothetical protein
MKLATALLAGIFAAQMGANTDTEIVCVPSDVFTYHIPIVRRPPTTASFCFGQETIELRKWTNGKGESLRMGYGPRSNVLVFHSPEPLTEEAAE